MINRIEHWRNRRVHYSLETHTDENGDIFLGMRKIGKVEIKKQEVELPAIRSVEVELSESK